VVGGVADVEEALVEEEASWMHPRDLELGWRLGGGYFVANGGDCAGREVDLAEDVVACVGNDKGIVLWREKLERRRAPL
jgi:hypothetical protein